MELTPFIENLIENSPVIGILLYLIVENNKRLDSIIDKCNTQQEELTNRFLTMVNRILDDHHIK